MNTSAGLSTRRTRLTTSALPAQIRRDECSPPRWLQRGPRQGTAQSVEAAQIAIPGHWRRPGRELCGALLGTEVDIQVSVRWRIPGRANLQQSVGRPVRRHLRVLLPDNAAVSRLRACVSASGWSKPRCSERARAQATYQQARRADSAALLEQERPKYSPPASPTSGRASRSSSSWNIVRPWTIDRPKAPVAGSLRFPMVVGRAGIRRRRRR